MSYDFIIGVGTGLFCVLLVQWIIRRSDKLPSAIGAFKPTNNMKGNVND